MSCVVKFCSETKTVTTLTGDLFVLLLLFSQFWHHADLLKNANTLDKDTTSIFRTKLQCWEVVGFMTGKLRE